MTDLDDFITQYVAVWNQPDPEIRKRSIAGTWSEQASLFNRIKEYHGHAGVEAAVQRSYDLFGSRGFLFRRHTSHHGEQSAGRQTGAATRRLHDRRADQRFERGDPRRRLSAG